MIVRSYRLDWKKLILCLAIPLAVGGLSGFLTRNQVEIYSTLKLPPLAPPSWLFPIVWGLLYLLMGFSSYRIALAGESGRRALTVYGIQLALNFLWPLLFFNLQAFGLAAILLVLLILMIAAMIVLFYRIDRNAALWQLPYFFWSLYACYLNLGIWFLNR